MKAVDILEHFLSKASWIDRDSTVDKIIAGDPEKEVRECLVTWMPSFQALRTTVERGISLLICHEPTFWDHRNDQPKGEALGEEKMQFILDNDLVLLRNHDCWDRWPEVGIPWAWAQFLGLGSTPVTVGADGYQHRYDIAPVTLDVLASGIAARCGSLGEPLVQVTGDGETLVSRIGIGTGCGCKIKSYQDMGCDCSVVCDDGSIYWSGIQQADDFGHPVIRVNHGTSEEPGMFTLTQYINDNIDGVNAELLPHGSTYRLVGGTDSVVQP